MADVLDIDNAEEFEVDDEGDRKLNITLFIPTLIICQSTFRFYRNLVVFVFVLFYLNFAIDDVIFHRGNCQIEGKSKKKKRKRTWC